MNSKKELWVLLASFVIPIVLGAAFFYWNPTAFTGSTVNYGRFVNPIITTEEQDVVFAKILQEDYKACGRLLMRPVSVTMPALKHSKT